MGILSKTAFTQLDEMGFEVHPTSFQDLIKSDDLASLRDFPETPEWTSDSILRAFSDFFAVHKDLDPAVGIFFGVFLEDGQMLTKKAANVYTEYFPNRVCIISSGKDGSPMAQWHHSSKAKLPLQKFILTEFESN